MNNVALVDLYKNKTSYKYNSTPSDGFTLIEILIAVAIVAIIGGIVVPNLQRRNPAKKRAEMIEQLNTLTQFAWQNAIKTGTVHKVLLDLKQNKVSIEKEEKKSKRDETKQFVPIKNAYTKTSFAWPKNLTIKQVIIESKDMLAPFAGKKTTTVWFFISPTGLTQEVIINMVDTDDRRADRKPRPVGLVLNPFSGVFKVHGSFQKK